MWLERGEHVSLVGPNGAGKTTLIETLAGPPGAGAGQAADRPQRQARLPLPARRGADRRDRAHGARGRQHATRLTPGKARALLGRFLFSGEDAEKPLDGLSGGERRRLSLAILVQSGANVLILDEPTNHLDLESREALEAALNEFSGSLLLVSHDRALLDAVGTRTIALEDRTLHSYVGGWPEYVRVREERAKAPAGGGQDGGGQGARRAGEKPAGAQKRNPPVAKAGERRQTRAAARAEIATAEAALRAIEDELADPGGVGHARGHRALVTRATRRPSAPSRSSTSAGRRSRGSAAGSDGRERRGPGLDFGHDASATGGGRDPSRLHRRRQRADDGAGPALCRPALGTRGDRVRRRA